MKTIVLVFTMLVLSFNLCFSQSKEEESKEKVNKQSVLIFKNTVYDYGTINKGDDGTAIFQFKNITKDNVQLTNVKASCGCTDTDWSREPIKKKKTGEIKVKYDTNIVGKFHKIIYVYIDKLENPLKLEIKGEVINPTI
ncbi:MAG: DUF1573 domain-containing protein [Bacteroidales bacterium]|jgi:hypothetical protein|nr:DUF1573 domain-containing protein [Bacteroidales bacterium]